MLGSVVFVKACPLEHLFLLGVEALAFLMFVKNLQQVLVSHNAAEVFNGASTPAANENDFALFTLLIFCNGREPDIVFPTVAEIILKRDSASLEFRGVTRIVPPQFLIPN